MAKPALTVVGQCGGETVNPSVIGRCNTAQRIRSKMRKAIAVAALKREDIGAVLLALQSL